MSKQPFFYSERHNEKHVTLYIIYDTREDNSAVLSTQKVDGSGQVSITFSRALKFPGMFACLQSSLKYTDAKQIPKSNAKVN